MNIIIIEGVDNTGKSTFIDRFLAKNSNFRAYAFPNSKELKSKNLNISSSNRCLCQCIDFLSNFYEAVNKNENIIFDRFFLSGIVYNKALKIDNYLQDFINKNAIKHTKKLIKKANIQTFVLTNKPFVNKESDYYSSLDSEMLQKYYLDLRFNKELDFLNIKNVSINRLYDDFNITSN